MNESRGASNWPTIPPVKIFLNIFLSITLYSGGGMDLIFAIQANDRELFVSRMDAVASQKECYNVTQDHDRLSKGCRSHQRLTVEAFAHGDAEGMRGPRCGWLRVKLVAPNRKPPPCLWRLFEVNKYEPASSILVASHK